MMLTEQNLFKSKGLYSTLLRLLIKPKYQRTLFADLNSSILATAFILNGHQEKKFGSTVTVKEVAGVFLLHYDRLIPVIKITKNFAAMTF